MTPVLYLLCASLEGEGAEVSAAVQAPGMVHGTQMGLPIGAFPGQLPRA